MLNIEATSFLLRAIFKKVFTTILRKSLLYGGGINLILLHIPTPTSIYLIITISNENVFGALKKLKILSTKYQKYTKIIWLLVFFTILNWVFEVIQEIYYTQYPNPNNLNI